MIYASPPSPVHILKVQCDLQSRLAIMKYCSEMQMFSNAGMRADHIMCVAHANAKFIAPMLGCVSVYQGAANVF